MKKRFLVLLAAGCLAFGAFRICAQAPAATTAYAASLVISDAPTRLHSLVGYNSSASAQFIQVFDAASVPANGSVPKITFSVPATSNFSLVFPANTTFAIGCVVCNSSTGPTKTAGSADCWFYGVTK